VKFDAGKEPMGLLSGMWLKGVAQVLDFGQRKYSAWNWRKGIAYSRLFDAAQRHLWAFAEGEDNDVETELSHLLHASCCIMFLYVMTVEKQKHDDRYKRGKNG
jgi:hypothetical protein